MRLSFKRLDTLENTTEQIDALDKAVKKIEALEVNAKEIEKQGQINQQDLKVAVERIKGLEISTKGFDDFTSTSLTRFATLEKASERFVLDFA